MHQPYQISPAESLDQPHRPGHCSPLGQVNSLDLLLASLKAYNLSRIHGFVPAEGSHTLLSYYHPWETLFASLSARLRQNNLTASIETLPVLELDHLRDEADHQRAYVVLAFLIHGYIHGCHHTTVPPQLAEPFLAVCEHLGLEPVLSYAGLCSWNWSDESDSDNNNDSSDNKQHIVGGLRVHGSFTNTLDEAAFYLTPVLVERAGGHLVELMLRTLCAARSRDWDTVSQHISTYHSTLQNMILQLGHLSACQTDYFYGNIRSFIAGLQDIFFQCSSGEIVKVNFAGGSAAQSSLFPFIDSILGIRHSHPLLAEMTRYMPRTHRDFLHQVSQLPSLPELIRTGNGPYELLNRIEQCKEELKIWRSKHINIVTRYIVLPASAAARKAGKATEVVGTGGSSPLVFLKEVRDDTTAIIA